MQQARTDAFKTQVQGYLDNLGSSQFYKDADRQVVNQKIKDTVGALNGFAQGPDLTDVRTQNELMNLVSGLSTDPDVLDRVMANKNYGRQLQKIQQIKDKNPDQYSAINEQWFHRQADEWLKDPNKKSFNVTYSPYVDTAKWWTKAAEDIAKNPDIRSEIMYATMPDGSRIPRTDREIKEVTLEKLYKGLLGSVPANVRGQFEIEYKNALAENGPQVALGVLNNDIEKYQAKVDELQYALDEGSFMPGSEAEGKAREKVGIYNDYLKKLIDGRDGVIAGTRKPDEFVPFSEFMSEKLMGVAKSYAYRQEKDSPDAWGLAYMKHQWDKEDAALEFQRKKALEKYKKDLDGPTTVDNSNEFVNAWASVLSPVGKGRVTGDAYRAIAGLTSEFDKDGWASKTFNHDKVMLSIAPLVSSVVPGVDAKAAHGYGQLLEDYKQYRANNPAHWTTGGFDQRSTFGIDSTTNTPIEYTWSSPGMAPTNDGHTAAGSFVEAPSFKQFIDAMAQNTDVVNNYKKTYGIDITRPEDIANANKVNQAVIATGLENRGVVATDVNGTFKITPMTGDNFYRASDGQPWLGAVARANQKQMEQSLGKANFDAWVKAGLIRPTGTSVKEGKELIPEYEMDMAGMPVVGDVAAMHDNYAHTHEGSSLFKDQGAAMKADFLKKYNSWGPQSNFTNEEIEASTEGLKTVPKYAKMVNDLVAIMNDKSSSAQAVLKARNGLIQMAYEYSQATKK